MRRAALPPWWQVRCLLRAPLPVGPGHTVSGTLRFEANESRGYNIHMTLLNANTGVRAKNVIVTQCALHHFQYTTQQSAPAAYYPAAAAQPAATAYAANGAAPAVAAE